MEKKTDYNKWKSRRWIICIWAMFVITMIVILGIIFKNDSYVPIATTLVAIPVAFTSLESVNKWKHQKENENDSSEIINKE